MTVAIYAQVKNTSNCWKTQARRHKEGFFSRAIREHGPVDTCIWISSF